MSEEQGFLFRIATIVIALMVLGSAGVYAYFILDKDPGTEPPPGVTLILGVALGQITNLLLGKNAMQSNNGVRKTAENVQTEVTKANTKLDTAAELVQLETDEVKARQETILAKLEELKKGLP